MADISRVDAAGLIPEAYSNAFLDEIIANSAVLSTFTTVRVGTKVNYFPVLSALPSAGFVTEQVDDPAGTKPTTAAAWQNKTVTVEEVAAIVPIHENVLEDSTIDLWGQVRPLVGQAFGAVIDDAVLFGTGAPASWADGLVTQAVSASHVATVTTDIADAFNSAYAFVEADGYDVSVVYAGPAMRSRLRGLRTDEGIFLYSDLRGSAVAETVYGTQLQVVKNGVWDDDTALAIVADRSKLVVALRTDMSYKVLTEATVGGINLAEKDMVALRVKMRLGWETATNATALNASPVPFAVIGGPLTS